MAFGVIGFLAFLGLMMTLIIMDSNKDGDA
jgi:hypothetical protein